MGSPLGQTTLFREVFAAPKEQRERSIGRSKELVAKRNECLVERFYYYGKFFTTESSQPLYNYSAILEMLQSEFFINAAWTIPEIINEHYELLMKLKREQPTRDYFKTKWPHLVW